MKGLYIHIPFCKSVCTYCDFPKIIAKEELKEEYLKKLYQEIVDKQIQKQKFDSVYIGGGTPNALSLPMLNELLQKISNILRPENENTIELNPELVTDELCEMLNKFHINRVSLGVESIDSNCITLLGRNHNKEIVSKAIAIIKSNHIHNINLDFIFGIPNSNKATLKNDIDYLLSQEVTHASFYCLIIEDKTVLVKQINEGKLKPLDDDLEADMYDYINERLETAGFIHYEISNYAKPGYESFHNKLYWNIAEYEGLGAGASSYLSNYRITNPLTVFGYLHDQAKNIEYIDERASKNEFFMLGLRLCSGVSITRYKELFGSDPFNDFNLSKLIKQNLLEVCGDIIKIPKQRLFIANLVFEEFVEDANEN